MSTAQRLRKNCQSNHNTEQDSPASRQPDRRNSNPRNKGVNEEQQRAYHQYCPLSQCNPNGVFPSQTLIPKSIAVSDEINLPQGIVFSPVLALENETIFMDKRGDSIPRCGTCRAYMNCYNKISEDKRQHRSRLPGTFSCFLCGRENQVSADYLSSRENCEQLQSSVYQCLSPSNCYARPPLDDCFVFLVDISPEAAESKMLYYFVAGMKTVLEGPEHDDLDIYFYTYDEIVHEYDFSGEETRCLILDRTLTASDLNFSVRSRKLADIRGLLFEFLDTLEQISSQNSRRNSNLTDSFNHVISSTLHCRPKIFILQANQALTGEPAFRDDAKNQRTESAIKPSPLQMLSKAFFERYALKMVENMVSISFYTFERVCKNMKAWADLFKITGSELYVYHKDSQTDAEKFYYDFSYHLGAMHLKEVYIELVISSGFNFHAIYGNFHRLKQFISFLACSLDPSKKVMCIFNNNPKAAYPLPYFALQIISNYRYKTTDFMSVGTVVLPITGSIDRIMLSFDVRICIALLARSYLSSLRLEPVAVTRKKIEDASKSNWRTLRRYCKQAISEEFISLILSYLAFFKSYHKDGESLANTFQLDQLFSERNQLMSANYIELSNYFSPYLFDLENMEEGMCREDIQFEYPLTVEPRFHNIKRGIFLLDNGLRLFLFIAKKHDQHILKQMLGRGKFAKGQIITEEVLNQIQTPRAIQVRICIKFLRQQKLKGWVPLSIVRCGENTRNQRAFYLNFYAQSYEQFIGCRLTSEQFLNNLSVGNQ